MGMAIFTQLVKVRRGKLVLALQSIRFPCPKSPKTECIRRTFLESEPGVSKSRYIGISIRIKYSDFSRFYKKKTGSIL